MKTIFSTIFLFLGFFFGCQEKSNPTNQQQTDKYSGTFTITQGTHIQQGTVVFTFSDSIYEQDGQIESPSTAKISEKGTLAIKDGNYIFNIGREMLMAVYPAWSLGGSFKYSSGNNSITLVQETGSTRYEMKLQKTN